MTNVGLEMRATKVRRTLHGPHLGRGRRALSLPAVPLSHHNGHGDDGEEEDDAAENDDGNRGSTGERRGRENGWLTAGWLVAWLTG